MIKLKSKIKLFAVAVVAVVAVGCTSQYNAKINFDKNDQISTAQYLTFAWLKEDKILSASDDLNPVMKLRVDDAVENAFIELGYKLVNDPEKADFAISYTVGSRDKIKVDSYPAKYNNGFMWGGGYYRRRGYYGGMNMGTETRVRNYTEGRLAVDVYDVSSRQPAWHGWAVKKISSNDKEEPEEAIKRLVNDVISTFK